MALTSSAMKFLKQIKHDSKDNVTKYQVRPAWRNVEEDERRGERRGEDERGDETRRDETRGEETRREGRGGEGRGEEKREREEGRITLGESQKAQDR
eukprot:767125-Hanusia_phi.AAC.5